MQNCFDDLMILIRVVDRLIVVLCSMFYPVLLVASGRVSCTCSVSVRANVSVRARSLNSHFAILIPRHSTHYN